MKARRISSAAPILILWAIACGTSGGEETSGGESGAPTSSSQSGTALGASSPGGASSSGSDDNTSGAADATSGGTGGTAGSASDGSAGAGNGNGNGGSGGSSPGDAGPVDCYRDGDGLTTIAFVNHCDGTLTFRGSDIEDGTLEPGRFACRDVGDDISEIPAKRYWAFIGEDPGAEHHTLAEFTFNTDFYDFDWYNISHVDAHNLPMQIVPVARPDCQTLTCAESLLGDCPEEGRYTDESGNLVACVSPNRDDPESPVAAYFESCDDAYAWSGDDQQGDDPSPVAACAGEDWEIVFCPEAE